MTNMSLEAIEIPLKNLTMWWILYFLLILADQLKLKQHQNKGWLRV